jgi:hypothetical protein
MTKMACLTLFYYLLALFSIHSYSYVSRSSSHAPRPSCNKLFLSKKSNKAKDKANANLLSKGFGKQPIIQPKAIDTPSASASESSASLVSEAIPASAVMEAPGKHQMHKL